MVVTGADEVELVEGRSIHAAVRRQSLVHLKPAELEVTAITANEEIMGLKHREHHTYGVQFHPESILSEHGHRLLENFLARAHA